MRVKITITHIRVLGDVFTNLTAGYIGLVLISPLPGASVISVLTNVMMAVVFFLLAVELKKAR